MLWPLNSTWSLSAVGRIRGFEKTWQEDVMFSATVYYFAEG